MFENKKRNSLKKLEQDINKANINISLKLKLFIRALIIIIISLVIANNFFS